MTYLKFIKKMSFIFWHKPQPYTDWFQSFYLDMSILNLISLTFPYLGPWSCSTKHPWGWYTFSDKFPTSLCGKQSYHDSFMWFGCPQHFDTISLCLQHWFPEILFLLAFFLTALFVDHIFLFLLNFSTGHPDMQPEMLFPSPLSFLIMWLFCRAKQKNVS